MIAAVLTTGRQDWGILRPVWRALAAEPALTPRLVVGGMHLRDGRRPEALDGVAVDACLDDLPIGDDDSAIAAAAARTAAGVAARLPELGAECLLLAGDRTETLAAAASATCLRLPVCHLHGGETTLGAIDDRCRHAITRLASLHAVAHPTYAERLRRWGEPEERIVVSGAPALDDLLANRPAGLDELACAVGRPLRAPLVLLTHHPATLGMDPHREAEALLAGVREALAAHPDATVVATRPNTDAGGAAIAEALAHASAADRRFVVAGDLGSARWWGLMARAAVLVGNSSSGLIEAPCFDLPVVNIGERQRGRLRVGRVADVPPEAVRIAEALADALAGGHGLAVRPARPSPLGDGSAGARISAALVRLASLPPAARLGKEIA